MADRWLVVELPGGISVPGDSLPTSPTVAAVGEKVDQAVKGGVTFLVVLAGVLAAIGGGQRDDGSYSQFTKGAIYVLVIAATIVAAWLTFHALNWMSGKFAKSRALASRRRKIARMQMEAVEDQPEGEETSRLTIRGATFEGPHGEADVTENIRNLIANDKLDVEVSAEGIGCDDPDGGHVKTLWIDYHWDGGPVQKIHMEEWADHPGGTPNRITLPTT